MVERQDLSKVNYELRINSIIRCREISQEYIEGRIDWLTFWENLPLNFSPFDPLDWWLDGLTENQKEEILFYFEWQGGEFGEYYDKRIPRDPKWVYGVSTEHYGWVDKDLYLKNYSKAFNEMKRRLQI